MSLFTANKRGRLRLLWGRNRNLGNLVSKIRQGNKMLGSQKEEGHFI